MLSITALNSPRDTPASPASDALGKQDFLKLLVMQLQNQDPLAPMNDREFIAQMAQLSQLETTSGLANQVKELVAAQERTQALGLVGREVQYSDANGASHKGRVSEVRLDGAAPTLVIDKRDVPLERIESVL